MADIFFVEFCDDRLLDLMENHGLAREMKSLDSLIFDEADHLMEMGFRPAMETILRQLTPSKVDKHRCDWREIRQACGVVGSKFYFAGSVVCEPR